MCPQTWRRASACDPDRSALVDSGRLRPAIARAVPLDRVPDAYRHATGPATGKVVLTTSAAR
ncbi:zinc-binding dehydrogenase [Geodermatophilus tzadiensis]|uniref:zinc-binding dehydrogenase n=1 Tax=Geodermatophilus tzadiensis TaxID=1137988 RepID=UPI000D04CEBE|nr:zinc-binding dehydrogenase [Geodermatophilus tzadiensis]